MKLYRRVYSVILALAMLFSVAALAEETPGFILPDELQSAGSFYAPAELNEIDRIQDQVASWEADMDMTELPDLDVYVYDNEGKTIEALVKEEAGLYGAIARPFTVAEGDVWSYFSAELYDDEWYLVRSDTFALTDALAEEICHYFRTESYCVGDSALSIHLPAVYGESLENKMADKGVVRTFERTELAPANKTGDPVRIDFIQAEIPEGLGTDDVVFDYATRTGSDTELVTINGRVFYKIVGWLPEELNIPLYSVLYLFPDEEHVDGVQFLYESPTNGYDLAVMDTIGF